jgi:hypothetical protein
MSLVVTRAKDASATCVLALYKTKEKLKLNSVDFSPQATYTDRATAACPRS